MEEHRRGRNVALIGAVLQVVFTAVLLVLWLWTGSLSGLVVLLSLAGGAMPWLMVAVMFYCYQLADREELELTDLAARGQGGASIFQQGQGEESRPAAARVATVERWVVPAFTLVWAAYHVTIGALMLRHVAGLEEPAKLSNTGATAMFLVLVWFVAFLFSRYATGMARQAHWRPLRAAGCYLFTNSLFLAATFVAMVLAWQGYAEVDRAVAYVIPALQLVLAAELMLNFVLDLYRPRVPGEERRLSFDSRLLNLLGEPGRIGHSIAEAMNYQFGFEVSKTWFYQLLSKAFVPLTVFGVAVLFAMSCVVIVPDGEQAVLLHWGQAADHTTLGPGLHWKWPWPIDTARRFDTSEVHQLFLGAGGERSQAEWSTSIVNGRELYLWTQEHGRLKELDFILAIPPKAREAKKAGEAKTPPVNIIKLVVLVQYKIRDAYRYGYQYADAEQMLRSAAHREMVLYCASATLDEPAGKSSPDRPEAIMTSGRGRAARELQKRIQAQAERLRLGVEITFTGMLAVHPPADAAGAFEQVIEAERRQDETRYRAQGESGEILAGVAGDPAAALELAMRIRVLEDLEILRDARDDPAEFAGKIQGAIQAIQKDQTLLEKEIRRAHLLGKQAEGGAVAEGLRDEQLKHLQMLQAIQKDPKGFDFSGPIRLARKAAEEDLMNVTGEPAAQIAKAQAVRWETELTERARYESIRREHLVWQANPQVYEWDRWLDVWDEVLPNATKYVVGVPPNLIEIWLNWERHEAPMAGATFEPEKQENPSK